MLLRHRPIQHATCAITVTAIFNASNIKKEQIATGKVNYGVPRAKAIQISSVPETVDSPKITLSRLARTARACVA